MDGLVRSSRTIMPRAAGAEERLHFLGNIDEDEKVDLLQRQEWVLNDLERRLRTQARLKALQDKQQN